MLSACLPHRSCNTNNIMYPSAMVRNPMTKILALQFGRRSVALPLNKITTAPNRFGGAVNNWDVSTGNPKPNNNIINISTGTKSKYITINEHRRKDGKAVKIDSVGHVYDSK